jgi:hypothetical protein
MAITSLGFAGYRCYQKGLLYESSDRANPHAFWIKKMGKVLPAADLLLGATAIILGALALVGILPIPPSMVGSFGYAAIGAGGLSVIIALASTCYGKGLGDGFASTYRDYDAPEYY